MEAALFAQVYPGEPKTMGAAVDDGGLFDMEPVAKPKAARRGTRPGTGPETPSKGATPYAGYTTPATTPATPATTPYTPAEELQEDEPAEPAEVWNAANPSMGVPVTIDRSLQVEGGCAKYDGCPALPRCVLCPSSPLYWRTAADYTNRRSTADRLGYRSAAHPRTCEED